MCNVGEIVFRVVFLHFSGVFAFHVFSVFILKFSNLFWMERHCAGLSLSKKKKEKKKKEKKERGEV